MGVRALELRHPGGLAQAWAFPMSASIVSRHDPVTPQLKLARPGKAGPDGVIDVGSER